MADDTYSLVEENLRAVDGPRYLTSFSDCSSAGGNYRKYHLIFVNREPFPYHLAISSQWMVHYHSSDMESNPWKIEEEERFLEEAASVLGRQAMLEAVGIARRLDLEYAGIDCAVLPDGRILVFEANSTMLVHRERDSGVLASKNRHVQRIVDAFERMLQRRQSLVIRAG